MNTICCTSAISYIDGDKGELLYRGYPIEQLAEQSSYLECTYLLLHGELPTEQQLHEFIEQVTLHTFVHENVKSFIQGFRYDAHPMGMFLATIGALSTFYPEAKHVHDKNIRMLNVVRLLAKVPTIAAWSFRHSQGFPFVYPDNQLSFAGNFLAMMKRMSEPRYKPNPILERALDVLFILHADHEQNCSTSVMRATGSSLVDPYSAVAAASAALYGPLHGGANEAVLRMLAEIGSLSNVPAFVKEVKEGKGEKKLMGFGHRVYKNYDPRAKLMRTVCNEVLQELGLENDRLFKLAMELEKIALNDEYFIQRKLYPNVDFYSGIIYRALGIPATMFTVLFAMGRMPGWIANWKEINDDPKGRIYRPRQIYTGETQRSYVPIESR